MTNIGGYRGARYRGSSEKGWKKRMNVELSGLARPRDWMVAIAIGAILVFGAMLIAFLAFG